MGSDSLGELLAAHPDISYQVTLPSPFLEVLATLLPILIIGGLLMFFFYKWQQANNSQVSFGKNKAEEDSGGAPRCDVCRCGWRR